MGSFVRPTDPGFRRDDEMVSFPANNPACRTSLTIHPPRPLRGALARRCEGGTRCGACGPCRNEALGRQSELPPGPLGVPARSWLTARSAHSMRDGPDESRARCRQTSRVARRKAPACRKARAIRICAFRRAIPPHTPDASRVAARNPHVLLERSSEIPPPRGVRRRRNRRFPGFFLWPRRNQPKFERLFMLAEQDVMGHVRERHGDLSPGAAFRLARGS